MIDIHCHLDGSLDVRTVRELSRMTGVALPTEDEGQLLSYLAFQGKGTLNDYLEKFRLPLVFLRSAECVRYAVTSLAARLSSMGLEYVEIRFAPMLHLAGGATPREIVEGALKGAQAADIPIGLILCAMRGHSLEANRTVMELAAEYDGRGVVGVDLAGAEALYPTREYGEVFYLAERFGLNITIHAGEADGADSIRAALDFGARRLGHAVSAASDIALLERIKREGIVLEICPTSNVQTGAVASIKEHPIIRYLDMGLKCAVCSDNMTVSGTDVKQEYERLSAAFPERRAELKECALRAREYSFEKKR